MMMLSLFLSISFAIFTQPLTTGLMLMTQTVLSAYIMFTCTKLSWYSFMLMIVMAGALLMVFMYVAVLIPTEPHARRSLWSLPIILPPAILMFMLPATFINSVTNNLPSTLLLKSSAPPTLMLIILLLLALMIVVHNTFNLKGPMRSY